MGQNAGQQVLGGHGGGRNGQGALDVGGGRLDLLLRPLAQAQDLVGIAVEDIAGCGKLDLLGGADHQLTAQFPLQCADVGADGGLGQVEGVGSLGKAFEAGHLHKDLQLLELHNDRSSLFFSGCGCYLQETGLE